MTGRQHWSTRLPCTRPNFSFLAKVNSLALLTNIQALIFIIRCGSPLDGSPLGSLFIFTAMVSVTEKAKDKIIELRQKEGLTDHYAIRVAVEGGGCSGLMYDLQFDTAQQPTDHVVEDKGIRIYVDKKSLLYLAGTELDFSDGLNGKGFQFKNPNASRTCGCGESFSV